MHVDVFTVQSSMLSLPLQVTDRPVLLSGHAPCCLGIFPSHSTVTAAKLVILCGVRFGCPWKTFNIMAAVKADFANTIRSEHKKQHKSSSELKHCCIL